MLEKVKKSADKVKMIDQMLEDMAGEEMETYSDIINFNFGNHRHSVEEDFALMEDMS